jgi:hypothetical protein
MSSPVVNSSPSTPSMSSKAKQKAPMSASPPSAGWISSRRPSLLGMLLYFATLLADDERRADITFTLRPLLRTIRVHRHQCQPLTWSTTTGQSHVILTTSRAQQY